MAIEEDGESPSISEAVEVLRPEQPYEGTDIPIALSEAELTDRAQQLRDPVIFTEDW